MVDRPSAPRPERPTHPKPDASITFVSVEHPTHTRSQLTAYERDLLFALGSAPEGRGVEGANVVVTIERFEKAGLVELRRPNGFLVATLTDLGRKAAQQGWYAA